MNDAGAMHRLEERSAPGSAAARLLVRRTPSGPPMTAAPTESSAEDPSAWIVQIAADKSREAFSLLFARFAPRVKGHLIRLGSSPEQAEELAQETLLAVWRKAAYFDPQRASAATWIFTIARNLRVDALRRERHPEALEHEPELKPEAEPAPEAVAETLQRLDRVRRALGGLPPDQVEVVRQSFFEEKPHSQISADLGLPLGTVKSRLRLALARLRMQLGDLL